MQWFYAFEVKASLHVNTAAGKTRKQVLLKGCRDRLCSALPTAIALLKDAQS